VAKERPQKSIRLPSVDDMMNYLHSQRALFGRSWRCGMAI